MSDAKGKTDRNEARRARRARKKPGPAKTMLTPEQLAQLEALAAVLSMEQIADYFGISNQTLRRRMYEDPSIMELYKKGKQVAIKDVGGALIQQARNGNTTAMIFYLKTQAGWRETAGLDIEAGDGLRTFVDALRK